jgi:membrane fusion protein (multidrug efflux system)
MLFLLSLWKNNRPAFIAIVICILIFSALSYTLYQRKIYITSDDALVHGNIVVIQSKVKATVVDVPVQVYQQVRKGQLLCSLEPSYYQITLKRAESLHRAALSQYQLARFELDRAERLFRSHVIPLQDYERAKTLYESKSELVATERANVERARHDLNDTTVLAPADGIIAARTAQPGLGTRSGTPLFGFVFDYERWVLANFKETDLEDLRVGTEVQLRFDQEPQKKYLGKVLGISPSTEGPFAAIAPDNAAGNFTKYVQRIPIRISIDTSFRDYRNIPVGISAQVQMRRS